MIAIKPYDEKYAYETSVLLKELQLDVADFSDLHALMIIVDGSSVVGASHYSLNASGQAVIDILYVSAGLRGLKLGDGLIRAMLNALFLRGYKSAYFMSNKELANFFDHMEFEPLLSEVKTTSPYYIRDGQIMHFLSDIDAFFSKPCKSERR